VYSFSNGCWVGKSRTGWAQHVACMEQVRKLCNIWVRKPEVKGNIDKDGLLM
jgi:hypothetical protein